MKWRDGFAATWGRDVRLIAVTGYGQAEDRRRTTAAGFDVHLVKPVSPEQLEQAIAGLGGRGRCNRVSGRAPSPGGKKFGPERASPSCALCRKQGWESRATARVPRH